jgi:hypothetical protein
MKGKGPQKDTNTTRNDTKKVSAFFVLGNMNFVINRPAPWWIGQGSDVLLIGVEWWSGVEKKKKKKRGRHQVSKTRNPHTAESTKQTPCQSYSPAGTSGREIRHYSWLRPKKRARGIGRESATRIGIKLFLSGE